MTLLEKAFENLEDCRYVLSLDVCALRDDGKVVVQNYYILKYFETQDNLFRQLQWCVFNQDIHDSVHLYGIDLKLHRRSLNSFSLMTPRLERVSKQNQGFSFPIHQKASLMHFFHLFLKISQHLFCKNLLVDCNFLLTTYYSNQCKLDTTLVSRLQRINEKDRQSVSCSRESKGKFFQELHKNSTYPPIF